MLLDRRRFRTRLRIEYCMWMYWVHLRCLWNWILQMYWLKTADIREKFSLHIFPVNVLNERRLWKARMVLKKRSVYRIIVCHLSMVFQRDLIRRRRVLLSLEVWKVHCIYIIMIRRWSRWMSMQINCHGGSWCILWRQCLRRHRYLALSRLTRMSCVPFRCCVCFTSWYNSTWHQRQKRV